MTVTARASGRRTAPTRRPTQRRDSRAPGRTSARPSAPPRPRLTQPHDWFAAQLLLVLSGQRPVHTLLGRTQGPAYDQLIRLAAQTPLNPVDPTRTAPVIRDVGAFQPRIGAVEVFARITVDDRLRALAFRLECGESGRWSCVAVELDVDRATGERGRPTPSGQARTARAG